MRSLVATADSDLFPPTASGAYDSRTFVARQGPGEAPWELWLRTPLPALAHLIAGFWAGDSDSPSASHRTVPDGEVALMFNLGPPQRVVDADGRSDVQRAALVWGLQERPLVFESMVHHPRAVTVRFRPLGAWTFFGGLALRELANAVVDLESVLGAQGGVEALRQRLIAAPHFGAALDLLEEWVATHLFAGPRAHPMTRAAWARLQATGGDLRVAALARDLGVSTRHLNDLFQREIGLSTKGMARILRFERATARLTEDAAPDLSSVALECGYYDQAHLNRDFRELAGLTPTEYLTRVTRAPGWREVSG